MTDKRITELDLQLAFYRFMFNAYHVIVPNVYMLGSSNEKDLFCIRRNNYCEEIEIKLSQVDFLNDFKKKDYAVDENNEEHYPFVLMKKHDALKQGKSICNRFSFLLPDTIINKCNIPDYAGLFIYDTTHKTVRKIKQGKLLHKRKADEKIWKEVAHKMNFKHWHDVAFQ